LWHNVLAMTVSSSPTTASRLSFLLDQQRVLEKIAREFSRDAERAGERADAAARAVEEMRDFLGALTELPRLPPPRSRARLLEAERLLRAEATAGVRLAIEPASDGSAEVSLNGRAPFHLPPQLAALMTILAARTEGADTEPATWVTRAEIANALSQAIGRTVKPAHVTRLIHRLKNRMRRAGENVFVLENSRRLGAWRVKARPDRRRPSASGRAGGDGG
jgi:hypothetical protein